MSEMKVLEYGWAFFYVFFTHLMYSDHISRCPPIVFVFSFNLQFSLFIYDMSDLIHISLVAGSNISLPKNMWMLIL